MDQERTGIRQTLVREMLWARVILLFKSLMQYPAALYMMSSESRASLRVALPSHPGPVLGKQSNITIAVC